MICKNCGAELEENQTVCPTCGESSEVALEQEQVVRKKPKLTKKQITKLVLAIVAGVLVLALVAGILFLALRKNDVYYKGVYQTSDFWANLTHDQVVATMGDYKLTNGQLQVYYWMQVYDLIDMYNQQYGDYGVYYMGIDWEKPLSEQVLDQTTGMTWEQYFLEDALYAWHRAQALADEAKQAGYVLPAEAQALLAEMQTSMEESAKEEGYASLDVWLQEMLGATVRFEDYYKYQETMLTGEMYFNHITENLEFTSAELDAYFQEHEEILKGYEITKTSGKVVAASLVGSARQGFFLIPAVFILPPLFGLLGIQMAQPIADFATFLMTVPLARNFLREMKQDQD